MKFGTIRSYIDGNYADSEGSRAFPIQYPATNETIGEARLASTDDLEKAIRAAQKAQREWASLLPAARSRLLFRASELIRERNDELAKLEVWDTGKPIQEALAVDIVSGADAVEYFAHAAALLKGDYYALGPNYAYSVPEPLGVVVGIGAWNYPFQIACWKSAPALAGGNAMIFKPSELTMMSALKLAEIYKEAGLPDGLFQVLLGDAEIGKAMVAHPEIHKISLTGEVGTGKKIMASAAATLKHVTLELGGKSPLIIFDDADIPNAVQAAMMANFYTQGEICSNGTRVFVHSSIQEAFLEELRRCSEGLIIGDPMDPATQIGALINEEHCRKVKGYIDLGLKQGATRFLGSDAPGLAPSAVESSAEGRSLQELQKGNFVAPTVFTGCKDEMQIVCEEIFGPVMSVLSFEDESEVIRRANNTPFGLAAGLFSKDIGRAHRVSQALQAGIIWINNYNLTPIEIPFGGYKQSGMGRENSLEALRHYTQIKTIFVETGDVDSPYRI
ncbi:MAG: betaine-aldehyde dehydrogenase [Leptospiraceae bacterium]|nr:betaine-aldehyde dehydrogenase [Leptospiraceae bacterium]